MIFGASEDLTHRNQVIAKGKDIVTTGVFASNISGQKLTFVSEGKKILDKQTGSEWNVLGHAISGDLSGERLYPIVYIDYFWFVWAAFQKFFHTMKGIKYE